MADNPCTCVFYHGKTWPDQECPDPLHNPRKKWEGPYKPGDIISTEWI